MGGSVSKTAMALSELCFKTLMEDGAKALLAVNAGACTPAVENIIEANTYLSGIGFESGSCYSQWSYLYRRNSWYVPW